MDKYKRLASNTILFAVSQFSSKLLSFFLTGFYINTLGDERYGLMTSFISLVSILFPLVSLSAVDAITRFSLDADRDKQSVFTTGLAIAGAGYVVFVLASPLLRGFFDLPGYNWLVCIYMFTSILRLICCHFVRSLLHTKLFADQKSVV